MHPQRVFDETAWFISGKRKYVTQLLVYILPEWHK